MKAAATPWVDHREESRLRTNSPAKFQAPGAIFAPSGRATIEEISACGVKIRTETQLHPDEELTLNVAGLSLPVHARVIWVQEAPPHHAYGSYGRKTWIAGCRLDAESIGRVPIGPAIVKVQTVFPWRKVLAVIVALGAAGIAVYLLVTYLFARIGSAVG